MDQALKLHDIKPLVEVEEFSMYYLMGVSLVGFILIFGILYLLFRWYKNKHRYNIRVEHKKNIDSLNLNDTKSTAYALTLYGATYKDDSKRHGEMYKNLTSRLQTYKYKKDVEAFDDETLGYIELYKGMIDV